MFKYLMIITILLLLAGITLRFVSKKPGFSLFVSPITNLKANQKTIALSFDDGPSDSLTPPLLDLLQKHKIKATFFVNGNRLEQFPEIGKRIVQEGHILGNHTFQHDRMVWKSRDFITTDLLKTDSLIRSCGQSEVSLFRPPFGDKFINLPLVINKLGKKMITWSVNPPAQYTEEYQAEKIIHQTLEQSHPGTIILLHDGWAGSKSAFLTAVDQIIIRLKKQGYSFSLI